MIKNVASTCLHKGSRVTDFFLRDPRNGGGLGQEGGMVLANELGEGQSFSTGNGRGREKESKEGSTYY